MADPPDPDYYDRIEYYTNALGFITTYYYTNDHLLAITDALSRTTRYYYDAAWNMTCIQMPNDTTMSNVYDAMNRVVKTIQPDGIEVQTEYDLIDRPIRTIYLSETNVAGQPAINGHPYTETRYGCCGVSEAIDRAGNPAKYSYDAVARLVKVMDAMSTVVSYTYNDLDEVTALTDGNGNKTTFEYSGIGMFEETNRYLTRIVYPGGNDRSFAYDDISDSISTGSWREFITKDNARYENGTTAGWYEVLNATRSVYANDLDDTSNAVPVTYASRKNTGRPPIFTPAWQYDAGSNNVKVFWGYEVTVTHEDNAVATYTYAHDGQLVYVEYEDDRKKWYKDMWYNSLSDGNMSRAEWDDGTNAVAFVYDKLGQLLCESNLHAFAPGLDHTVSYTYDPVGNRTGLVVHCTTSIAGTSYAYDDMDRLTNMASGGIFCSYAFTDMGFLTNKLYSNGVGTQYSYDSIGRLTGLIHAKEAGLHLVQHCGLARQWPILLTKNSASGTIDTSKKTSNNMSYVQMEEARGKNMTHTSACVRAAAHSEIAAAVSAQMITGITRGTNAVSFGYDNTYQLTSEHGQYQTNAPGGAQASATVTNRFAYDRAGNRVSHSTIDHGTSTIVSKSYRHTSDNQLTGIYWNANKVTLGGNIEQAWTVLWVRVQQNAAGSQPVDASIICQRGQAVAWEAREITVSGSGSIMFTVTVAAVKSTNTAAAGSILIWTNSTTVTYTKTSTGSGSIKYTYDNNGNRTYKWTNGVFEARYFYDIDNQLVGISFNNDNDHSDAGDYTYEYDPFGRRIRATEDSTNRYFIYDGLDVIAELDSTGGVTKTYVRGSGLGGGIGDIVAAWSMVDGQWLYFSYNHRGDVVTVTSNTGARIAAYEYDAFGSPLNPEPGTLRRVGFSSKEYDAKSGLSYYGFRYYDAQSGRWLTKDPSGSDGPNYYMICHNKPVDDYDKYGLWGKDGHDQLFDWAFLNVLCPSVLENLKTQDHEWDVSIKYPIYHCMMWQPSNKNMLQQARESAKRMINQFRDNGVVLAKWYAEQNKCSEALTALDKALHIVSDCSCPAHMDSDGNPKVWKGGPQWLLHGDWPWPNPTGLSQEHAWKVKKTTATKLKAYFDEAFSGTPCEKDGSFMKQ